MTIGNPLAALTEPPIAATRRPGRVPVGTIGDWKIYEVKKGGMGDVYICGRDGVEGEYALKSFQSRLFFDAPSRAAFLREITAWLRLTGTPFVMPALGVEEDRGRLLVRMLAVGRDNRGVGTIRDLIAKKCASPTEVFRVALQFASGMRFTGKAIPGVSHGDLTPENLLYNGGPVLISDFGLVAIGRGEKGLRATPRYEAPEYSSTGPSSAGDVYSFGIIVDELIKSCTGGGFLSVLRRRSTNNELLRALGVISQSCRARDPEQRPSFEHIGHQLFEILKSHPDELRDEFATTAMLHGNFRDLQAELAPDVAGSLLKVGAPDAALQVIDMIPEVQTTGMVLALKGNALSLLDQDEKALPCFEQALRSQLSDAERLLCRSDYALSLKRLGRLEEAKRIYLDLLATATDDQLPQVVVNLAGVYQEGKEYQDAFELLSRFIRQRQDEPLAFAALGMACEKLHRHKAAAAHYQRAVALAPQIAHIQVALARECLELGRWQEADQALYAAHQQGYVSREWLKLAIVTAILTGRSGDAEALTTAAKRDLPADDFKRLEKDALELTVTTARKAVGGNASETAQTADEAASTPPGEPTEPAEPLSPPVAQRHTGPADAVPTDNADSPFEPAGFPFFTIRFYLPENTFSCDFYDDIDSPAYVEHFLESWNRFRRDPAMSHGAEPRPTPFYFHVCPSCCVSILTNRDAGAGLQCGQCNHKSSCISSVNAKTDELLERVNKGAGKRIKSNKGLAQYVVFQPLATSPEELMEMKRLCRDAGFIEAEGGAATRVGYLAIARARNAGLAVDESREIIVVSKLCASDERSHSGDTPQESDRLVRSLRRVAPVWSFSTQIDPTGGDLGSLLFSGRTDELEQRCRSEVASSPEDIGKLLLLVQVLISNNKIREAESFALRATVLAPADASVWSSLAMVERHLKNYEAAIEHAERAVSMDPLEREALVTLFLTYRQLGDEKAATETWSRISALGGPAISTQ
jgi:tetratricopeptide (TPR) repeat protein